jgi:hypothetical protein
MKYFNRLVSRHMSSSVSVLATITALVPSCAHAHHRMYISALHTTLSVLLWLNAGLMCLLLLREKVAALLIVAAGIDVYPLTLDGQALIVHGLARIKGN